MFMFRPQLYTCGYFGQRCCVKEVFSIIDFKIKGFHPSEGAGNNIHKHKLIKQNLKIEISN